VSCLQHHFSMINGLNTHIYTEDRLNRGVKARDCNYTRMVTAVLDRKERAEVK
jgi:hypothetical protein